MKLLSEIFPYFISVVVAVITGLISVDICKKQIKSGDDNLSASFKKELEVYVQKDIYEAKKEALRNAMSFLDVYFSWHSGSSTDVIRQETTREELTLWARKCYNELCLVCGKDVLLSFDRALFGQNGNKKFGVLNEFRNVARKELGLDEVEYSSDHVFYSVISTLDLNKHQSSNN